jgi:inorganic triphosphatase YgiF
MYVIVCQLDSKEKLTSFQDLYSYNIEQSMGHKNANVLTVFMDTQGMTLQEAANHLGKVFGMLMQEHLTNRSMVRSFGPQTDRQVETYLRDLSDWVVGNLEWSFASQRYFGTESDKIRKGAPVQIMTKGVWDEN